MDKTKREPVSHTRKVAFRSCRRMHHLMYDLGVRPIKEAIQLWVGNLLHTWLECWFRAQQTAASASWIQPGPPLALSEEERAERHPVLEQWTRVMELGFAKLDASYLFEAARLRAMVLAYHIRWSTQAWDQKWDVLAVEPTFTALLIDPATGFASSSYERSGRLDLVVDVGGWEWAVEHKSHQGPLDPDDDYWVKLRSDAQCSDYHIGARALGHDIAGIIYDVVCKPDIEPKMATPVDKRKYTKGKGCKWCGGKVGASGDGVAHSDGGEVTCDCCNGTGWTEAPHLNANQRDRDETPGEYGMRCLEIMLAEPHRYLHRRPVVRLEKELESHEMDDWATVEMIAADKVATYHPRNPDACFNWHRMCDYHPICYGGISHTDTRLYQVRRKQQNPQPTIEEF